MRDEELVGKTIKSIENNGYEYPIIWFTDGTHARVGAFCGDFGTASIDIEVE